MSGIPTGWCLRCMPSLKSEIHRLVMAKKTSPKRPAQKESSADSTSDMNALLRKLQEMLAGDSGQVIEKGDLYALMASLSGPSANDRLSDAEADAKDEAQQLAFDAMEAETEAKARKLAKRALKLDPDCVDALLVMVRLDARTPREHLEALQKVVAAGERSLGARYIAENQGHFWMLLETRPYMRALANLAEALRGQGIRLDAIKIYERMLRLNPNDNQGARDPLLGLYLETGNLSEARRILSRYKQDGSANFAWARVLERLLAGNRKGAAIALAKARMANRHLELFLTMQRPLPKEPPEMYSPGSEEEAVLCLSYLSGAWAEHKEAASWLFEQLAENGATVPSETLLKQLPVATGRVQ